MSYDQLMEHAWSIKTKAVNRAIMKKENDPAFAAFSGPEGYFSDIPERYEAYAGLPDPAGFDASIARLQRVMTDLSPGQNSSDPVNKKDIYPANVEFSKITTAGGLLLGWDGDAANAFKKYFLDPFPLILQNQFILVSMLKSTLHATQALWAAARKDLDGIAEATMAALDNDPCCDPNKWTFDFTVIAAVATIGGVAVTAVTDGLAAPLVLATVDAVASTAAAKVPEGIKDNKTGNTAIQIVNAMWTGLEKVADQFRDTEKLINVTVDALEGDVGGRKDLFVSARPHLADATAANVTSSAYLGGHD
ncbi:hypothetical protein BJ973_000473 [Actinoplanes tereljensis]|uniref:Uncharacterized protein n=1 Tax=Paractinoplanes tereljensis TaxID=571912 RepID=A0A919NSE6_9ACTN|nr:hypothetical protein [Actinoplanes tereljensis]GIF23171.1 hypothetical protein Ate02nite_59010 [Actinoplanes tereljensis]